MCRIILLLETINIFGRTTKIFNYEYSEIFCIHQNKVILEMIDRTSQNKIHP